MPPIKCFFLEPADLARHSLRRYSNGNTPDCCPLSPGTYSYHDAMVLLAEVPAVEDERGILLAPKGKPENADPRWPLACGCGYEFTPDDHWQVFQELLYRRSDTGELIPLRNAPPGAMWHADWRLPQDQGPDGHCLMVMTPGREWCIDSRARNCTRPDDNEHRCWVRHGNPPDITVDKCGNTCNAGAGSILAGSYHGFLRNGHLVDC